MYNDYEIIKIEDFKKESVDNNFILEDNHLPIYE